MRSLYVIFEGASWAEGVVPMSYVAVCAADLEVVPDMLFCSGPPNVATICGVGKEDCDLGV